MKGPAARNPISSWSIFREFHWQRTVAYVSRELNAAVHHDKSNGSSSFVFTCLWCFAYYEFWDNFHIPAGDPHSKTFNFLEITLCIYFPLYLILCSNDFSWSRVVVLARFHIAAKCQHSRMTCSCDVNCIETSPARIIPETWTPRAQTENPSRVSPA
jgi:hypothetical protein